MKTSTVLYLEILNFEKFEQKMNVYIECVAITGHACILNVWHIHWSIFECVTHSMPNPLNVGHIQCLVR